ncbi:MAG: heme lyase CcmF/NrfE family subunit [Anaerolineae bacterium]|jgi:cytochrome c-type biogenesis protein CcmF|nr:heme lyase CcmF/NrfE family subunit [Anaerolineae bacterium]MDH7472475.1 heme lyase CcmF/NrfE family subunit [Anaerolineae bacterium]
MVVAEIGHWSLVLVLIATLGAAVAFIVGAGRSTRLLAGAGKALIASWVLITLAIVILTYALLARQFPIKYVYEHTSITLPLVYTLSALWAGQEGSLLLWLWLVAGFTLVAARRRAGLTGLHPYALAVLSIIQAFFAAVLVFESNPFTLLPETPSDGFGLNPLLQNVGMVVHPPLIFIGYAAFAVPFALSVANLIAGCLDSGWLRSARQWGLFAWGALGAGILVGAWWAYRELGWGGYWSWDPVENASLIPWLTGTARLHATMAEEQRGVFRAWNVALVTATFLLCLFATLVTRSGFIQSVHAFGRSRIGYYFLGFIAVWLLLVVILAVLRRRELSSRHELRDLFSRESGLLLSNLLLVGVALAVLLGTLFPALMEIVHGTQAALEQAFYERVISPLALTVIVLMGVCPWLVWGRTQPEILSRKLVGPAGVALLVTVGLVIGGVRRVFAVVSFGVCAFVAISILSEFARGFTIRRQSGENPTQALVRLFGKARHRYGGYLVHLSIVLISIGITGSSVYKVERLVALDWGEAVTVGGYTLTYEGLQFETLPDKELARATLRVSGHQRVVLSPELNYYHNMKQQVSEVAVLSSLKEDLYVALVGWDNYGELASFLILVNPLVTWLWIGGGLMISGTIIALWPKTAGGQR